MTGKWTRAGKVALTIAIPAIAILGTAFFLTLFLPPLLIPPLAPFNGLTAGQQLAEYRRILAYFVSPQDYLHFRWLPLAPAGEHHFAAVRQLIRGAAGLTLLALGGSAIGHRWAKRHYQLGRLLAGWPLVASGGTGLLAIAILRFPSLFLRFHQWAFADQTWQFTTKKEPIIRLLSLTFFWRYLIVWGCLVAALMLLWRWGLTRALFHFFSPGQPGLDRADHRRDQGNDDDGEDDQ